MRLSILSIKLSFLLGSSALEVPIQIAIYSRADEKRIKVPWQLCREGKNDISDTVGRAVFAIDPSITTCEKEHATGEWYISDTTSFGFWFPDPDSEDFFLGERPNPWRELLTSSISAGWPNTIHVRKNPSKELSNLRYLAMHGAWDFEHLEPVGFSFVAPQTVKKGFLVGQNWEVADATRRINEGDKIQSKGPAASIPKSGWIRNEGLITNVVFPESKNAELRLLLNDQLLIDRRIAGYYLGMSQEPITSTYPAIELYVAYPTQWDRIKHLSDEERRRWIDEKTSRVDGNKDGDENAKSKEKASFLGNIRRLTNFAFNKQDKSDPPPDRERLEEQKIDNNDFGNGRGFVPGLNRNNDDMREDEERKVSVDFAQQNRQNEVANNADLGRSRFYGADANGYPAFQRADISSDDAVQDNPPIRRADSYSDGEGNIIRINKDNSGAPEPGSMQMMLGNSWVNIFPTYGVKPKIDCDKRKEEPDPKMKALAQALCASNIDLQNDYMLNPLPINRYPAVQRIDPDAVHTKEEDLV